MEIKKAKIWERSIRSKTLKAIEDAKYRALGCCNNDDVKWYCARLDVETNWYISKLKAGLWARWILDAEWVLDAYDSLRLFDLHYKIEQVGLDTVITVRMKVNKYNIEFFKEFVYDFYDDIDIEDVKKEYEKYENEVASMMLEIITNAIKEWDVDYLAHHLDLTTQGSLRGV